MKFSKLVGQFFLLMSAHALAADPADCSVAQGGALAPLVLKDFGPAAAHLLYAGNKDLHQQVTLAFGVCNTGKRERILDVFSFGDDIVSWWVAPNKNARPSTRAVLKPGEARQIESTMLTSASNEVPLVIVSEQGVALKSVFLEYLVNDQPSSIPLQTIIKHLQSGWIDHENDPPYRICVDNPPPSYHLSVAKQPTLNITNAKSSNGDSHPRGCGGKWADCTRSIAADAVCYDVKVQGHVKWQTSIFGPGDETDFVWFDLELTAWYDRMDEVPQWVELIKKPATATAGKKP